MIYLILSQFKLCGLSTLFNLRLQHLKPNWSSGFDRNVVRFGEKKWLILRREVFSSKFQIEGERFLSNVFVKGVFSGLFLVISGPIFWTIKFL